MKPSKSYLDGSKNGWEESHFQWTREKLRLSDYPIIQFSDHTSTAWNKIKSLASLLSPQASISSIPTFFHSSAKYRSMCEIFQFFHFPCIEFRTNEWMNVRACKSIDFEQKRKTCTIYCSSYFLKLRSQASIHETLSTYVLIHNFILENFVRLELNICFSESCPYQVKEEIWASNKEIYNKSQVSKCFVSRHEEGSHS